MITVEHVPAADTTRTNYDAILVVKVDPRSFMLSRNSDVEFRWFDDGSAGVDINIDGENTWFSLGQEDTLTLQAALNKAFPV